MKKHKLDLYIAALAFLICVFTPYNAHAQDDGPVPWPCRAADVHSLNRPWCNSATQDDDAVLRPYRALAQDNGLVPRLNNILASITPSMGGEILYQPALFEGRRREFASIRDRWMDASVAHIRISEAFYYL
jgi:hypothetical protein